MSSDADYMSFLDKANKDTDEGRAQAQSQSGGSKAQFKATDSGSSVPKEIRDACKNEVYVSDADEPFEEVSLKWDKDDGLPDEVEFAQMIQHWEPEKADITIMDPSDWDSDGKYNKMLEAVRQATKGNDVRVYRVARDRTRVEYWVISRGKGAIVGVKALAVES